MAWHIRFILVLLLGFYSGKLLAQNEIVTENAKAGNPSSEWQISGAGDLSIQGFATDISYNKGETARFKIKTDARAYTIRIYRLGYYQGNGARLQGTATVTATLPQSQPSCLFNATTGLLDCGNWGQSAQWAIPSTAVSGVYIAKLIRTDTQGSSHIVFIVRDDSSTSDLLFQTSDATWQAYNIYGDNNNGKSLYTGVNGKASKVSYNRPFVTRNGGGGGGAEEDWLFNAEYPMIRWVEANGYNVSYSTDMDSDRRGNLIKNHKVFLSVGHDEYWSGGQRANVTAARDAGIHAAFFSGNEIYWKTRWENSVDGSGTSYRTLVCYKEGTEGENTCNGKCDPTTEWTGLWRSGCQYTNGGACQPENALSGQISWNEASGSIQVPDTYKSLRFWRNTSVASLGNGQTASLGTSTIGYEWNPDQDAFRSSYPSGRIILSRTVLNGMVHHLSLYRHSSGALVFGAGTVQYTWGLDSSHDRGSAAPSVPLQQATVNLFADMGAQPGSLRSGLVAATASSDTQAPGITITSPVEGANFAAGAAVTISGTSSDANVVAGVEVSTDGGATWRLATGTTNWTFAWTATQGATTIKSRAFDDSGNMSSPATRNITVGDSGPVTCPCTVFKATDAPTGTLNNDGQGVQLGTKFRTSIDGFITGTRFYKQSGNTGTHIGQLYSNAGILLAQATFVNESASGWQEVAFASPVAVTAGSTYVISYYSSAGHYSSNDQGFSQAVVNGPLTGLQNGTDGPNGVYAYANSPVFPTQNYQASNYWVDVVFITTTSTANKAPTVAMTSPANNASFTAPANIQLSATASDQDGTVAKVEFYNGATLLGQDLTSPYSFTWNSVGAGTYQLTAKATDDQGAVATSAAINITVTDPANQAPVATITSPANNASYLAPASVTIAVSASDPDGTISKVEFYNGSVKLGEDLTSPYTYTWSNVAAGNYALTAKATDNSGATGTSAVVNVSVTAPANQPPTITLSSPVNNAEFTAPATIAITANAADTDGTVSKVEFFSGTTKLGEDIDSGNGWSFSWDNVSVGTYTLTAVATDNLGAVTTSAPVSITVTNPASVLVAPSNLRATILSSNQNRLTWQDNSTDEDGFVLERAAKADFTGSIVFVNLSANSISYVDAVPNTKKGGGISYYRIKAVRGSVSSAYSNIATPATSTSQPPSVVISSPANGASFPAPANITIAATASDADGTVSKVEFFSGTTKLGEDTNGTDGWGFSWTSVLAGTYSLTARATDNEGATATSAAVNISVTGGTTAPGAPAITRLSAVSGYVGSEVTIYGANLSGVTKVTFGPSAAEIIPNSNTSTEVRVVVPAVNGKLPKSFSVTVTTPYGSATAGEKYTVNPGFAANAMASLQITESQEAAGMMAAYPNPFKGKATVRFVLPENGNYKMSLYDEKGALLKLVKQGQAKAQEPVVVEIDGTGLAKGIYILRLESKGVRRSTKLVLDR